MLRDLGPTLSEPLAKRTGRGNDGEMVAEAHLEEHRAALTGHCYRKGEVRHMTENHSRKIFVNLRRRSW